VSRKEERNGRHSSTADVDLFWDNPEDSGQRGKNQSIASYRLGIFICQYRLFFMGRYVGVYC
jgi:hypothetical protein